MKKSKENEKKYIIILLIVMVALYALGYAAGGLIARLQEKDSLSTVMAQIRNAVVETVPPLYLLLAVIGITVTLFLYFSCRKMYRKLKEDMDNDELWDELELKLNGPLILANAITLIDLLFFSITIFLAVHFAYGAIDRFHTVILIADFVMMIVVYAVTIFVPKKIVEIEKDLNPEKEGSIFDLQFDKKWLNSSDEAQKLITYKAAYKSFKANNTGAMFLWCVAFLLMFLEPGFVYAVIFVSIGMIINNLSFAIAGARYEKSNK